MSISYRNCWRFLRRLVLVISEKDLENSTENQVLQSKRFSLSFVLSEAGSRASESDYEVMKCDEWLASWSESSLFSVIDLVMVV